MAVKKRVPPTSVRSYGEESPAPGRMSITRTVPPSVPSLLHSSRPCVPSPALNEEHPARLVKGPGLGGHSPWADVLNHHGPGLRPVALSQFAAVDAVVCREEERSAHVCEIARQGTVFPWRPAVDLNRIVLGGQIVAVFALLTIRAIVKARAKGRG